MLAAANVASAASGSAWAQTQRVARVGILAPNSRIPRIAEVIRALGELGYHQGQNLVIELRSADDVQQRLEPLAAELARLPVDVIVTFQTPATLAARRATSSVPIVMAGAALDPVAAGIARSLAQPGGNVTGLVGLGASLSAKTIGFIRELRPSTRRIAMLVNADDPFTPELLRQQQQAARPVDIELQVVQLRSTDDYGAAFASFAAGRADAVFVQPSLMLEKAIALSVQHRLPSFSFVRVFATSGGLFSYAADSREAAQRVASFVDRLLKGGNAAQLPIEQPTSFELVLNRGTAKALGITLPRSILVQATEVIG